MAAPDITINVLLPKGKLTVEVEVLDVPGPSGYQAHSRIEKGVPADLALDVAGLPDTAVPALPEIGSAALASRRSLELFLRGLAVQGRDPIAVVCRVPRLPKLYARLGADPSQTAIDVDLSGGEDG